MTTLFAASDFSIGESLLGVKDIVKAAKELGYQAAALTDTMTVSGMTEFTTECQKAGIKPVIGVRLRIVADPTLREKVKQETWFPKLYIRNEAGLRRVFRLLTLANSDDRFYQVPRLGFDDLLSELHGDDLLFSSGDALSALNLATATEVLEKVSASVCASNAFVELCPIATPLFDKLNKVGIDIAGKLGLPVLATLPTLYDQGDADTFDVYNTIIRNAKMSWAFRPYLRDQHPKPYKTLINEAVEAKTRLTARYPALDQNGVWKQALENNADLPNLIAYEWAKMPVSLPKMAADEHAALVKMCKEGWQSRLTREVFGHKPDAGQLKEVYLPRLQYELRVLKDLNFAGYFLLVADIVRWSKSQGILVGPGRGSVGGSLVAYLCGITDIDPIPHNLLFERFINPERNDLPDADLDFMSERRAEVIQYITEKYGTECVAGISNYGTLAGASAIRDVGRVYEIDPRVLGVSKLVPKVHGIPVGLKEAAEQVGELEKFSQSHPEIWRHATKLEKVMRSLGRHAAGIVVAGEPLVNRAVIERRQGEPTINWDKRIVEDMGLVKMDILGLSTLDLISVALANIKQRRGKTIDFLDLPLTDRKVLDAFAAGDTVGIFQFESGGMRRLLKNLGSDGDLSFEDITAATALYRPGPMDSGMMEDFVNRKLGYEPISYEHPAMEGALKNTYGVCVYQEQVMQLARELAGFTFAEADKLRKAMGKKDKDLMASFKEKWVKGCVGHIGWDETAAGALFDKIEKFAGYGFNKSHAAEYSLISYISMWLKVYHPTEFFAAALTILKEEKLEGLVADASARGIAVSPPDINWSTGQFEIVTDTRLVIPFNRVKGVSDNTTNAILEARKAGPFADMVDFLARVEKRKCNVRHQDVLRRVGAFVCIEPGSLPADHPDRIKDQIELMPGLVASRPKVMRDIKPDAALELAVEELIHKISDEQEPARIVLPYFGKKAKFMVVTDAPGYHEEQVGQFTEGKGFDYIKTALAESGMRREDAYFTGLLKKAKTDKFIANDDLVTFGAYLDQEIETLKPPVILCLGNAVARHFIKNMKGSINDHVGKTIYSPALDATIIVGFNPAQIAFDADKQEVLDALFAMVSDMLA